MPASPVSPQYRYTRDEQQLSQLLRAIDGVTYPPQALLTHLTLTTVYHKLVPLCGPAEAGGVQRGGWTRCEAPLAPATSTRVFDLAPAGPECSSEACHRQAVAAARAHAALLANLTRVRTRWANLTYAVGADGAPHVPVVVRRQPRGWWDRWAVTTPPPACAEQSALLRDVAALLGTLGPTVAQLRAAAAAGALAADLVAAPRQAEVWPAEKLSPTVAWALYELSGRSAPDPSANTYVAWRIKHF